MKFWIYQFVNKKAIEKAKFKVVVDGVNSTGGIAVPLLLEDLVCMPVKLYCEPTGHFPHNPEPLKEHLADLSEEVVKERCRFRYRGRSRCGSFGVYG